MNDNLTDQWSEGIAKNVSELKSKLNFDKKNEIAVYFSLRDSLPDGLTLHWLHLEAIL